MRDSLDFYCLRLVCDRIRELGVNVDVRINGISRMFSEGAEIDRSHPGHFVSDGCIIPFSHLDSE